MYAGRNQNKPSLRKGGEDFLNVTGCVYSRRACGRWPCVAAGIDDVRVLSRRSKASMHITAALRSGNDVEKRSGCHFADKPPSFLVRPSGRNRVRTHVSVTQFHGSAVESSQNSSARSTVTVFTDVRAAQSLKATPKRCLGGLHTNVGGFAHLAPLPTPSLQSFVTTPPKPWMFLKSTRNPFATAWRTSGKTANTSKTKYT
ncbi:hypothetical protein BDW02DRAFT_93329 [Decorospora gaudefroyi]|uniref:Uncharacterized protein n=1 Tax=Decorospora gaudefroyi TaxID=184978 RepID=A0A6A5K3F2_9PLEO|nr:hypothetical protein BDW02DRAFT_93329 [Decorospora gaudefroyi]